MTGFMQRTLVCALVFVCATAFLRADDRADAEFFEQKIRPVLVERCFSCHSADASTLEGKFRVDTRSGLRAGGESGPAIVPGKPESSLLIHAVRRSDKDLAMPPDEELSAQVVADFVAWVERGAYDPRKDVPSEANGPTTPKKQPSVVRPLTPREEWTFHPPTKPEVPTITPAEGYAAWAVNPVDAFLWERLHKAGIKPATPATPETLIRRLSNDLTGLPPEPAAVDRFVEACVTDRQRAVASLVDELLASPHYGEHWGRHWLDVVRYADSLDSRGQGSPGDLVDGWRYRDWVVKAFNEDLPYTEFLRMQVAGDLLAAREWNPEAVIATGLYAIGNWGNGDSDKQKVHTDIVDDQIDVTSRAFLGLTMACARCHDHKFDPISTADYYAMAGFFFSTRIIDRFNAPTAGEGLARIELLSPEERRRRDVLRTQLAGIEAKLNEGMQPFNKRNNSIAGQNALVGFIQAGIDNPSLVLNTGSNTAKYITITLPGRSLAVHPGPREVVTAVWKSPVDGSAHVQFKLADVDGTCGNGIEWFLRLRDETLAMGVLANGASMDSREINIPALQAGELVRLVISPHGEYTCDSTQIDMTVTDEGGRIHSLTASLLENPDVILNADSPWKICRGDASVLGGERPDIAALTTERDRLKGLLQPPPMCQGLQEGGIPNSNYPGVHDAPIHVRGNYRRLGAVQPRGFPAVFHSPTPLLTGSGREALADWLTSPQNPLMARVLVNRIWQHHFGEGIVRTVNNFGALGEAPTHPELLDWLAVTFRESGYHIKSIHRLICLSQAYQQSTAFSPETFLADPQNHLLSRQTRHKRSAEELRDALLVAPGPVDLPLGGPSKGDLRAMRRSLYLTVVRSDRSSFQMLFDGADPNSIVERRNDSIVAPQALWMMNHPFVLQQAERLRDATLKEGDNTTAGRLEWLCRRLYARSATSDEIALTERYLSSPHESQPVAWLELVHALLCSNEFLFIE